MNNGKDFNFLCDEDEANNVFKQAGNRVLVNLKYQQYWNPFTNTCDKEYIFKSGKIITSVSNSKNKIQNIKVGKYKFNESGLDGELKLSRKSASELNIEINTSKVIN